jgi:hypothetical protein
LRLSDLVISKVSGFHDHRLESIRHLRNDNTVLAQTQLDVKTSGGEVNWVLPERDDSMNERGRHAIAVSCCHHYEWIRQTHRKQMQFVAWAMARSHYPNRQDVFHFSNPIA